jgi:MFS family permease
MGSIALHRKLGFQPVGTIRSAGFKFGRWVDSVLMQRLERGRHQLARRGYNSMITRRAILCLGLFQLISWGTTYYLIGIFGDRIASDLGWSPEFVFAGFSLALLVMGLLSSVSGSFVDRHGGAIAMSTGSILNAGGCLTIATAWHPATYLAGWCLIGLGMRLSLYDAAFAALARIAGPEARRPMAQITLLGGLASTTFWPIGTALADTLGWRGALCAYAGFALLAIPLCLPLPKGRYRSPVSREGPPAAEMPARPDNGGAAFLYSTIVALTGFLNSGMSAHMIPILIGLGLGSAAAVSAAMLRGVGQSAARLCDVLFGRMMHPLTLNVISTSILPIAFTMAFLADDGWLASAAFAFSYGAGNGLTTITRGSLPLVLFDHRAYGRTAGRLIAPSFLLASIAPLSYAYVISSWGEHGALVLSLLLSGLTVFAALTLKLLYRGPA